MVVNTSNVINSRRVGHPAAINRYSFFNLSRKQSQVSLVGS